MRSLASALQLLTTALGSYVATAVTSIVNSVTTQNGSLGWLPNNLNQGRLDYYYVVLVILSIINVGFFVIVAHFYKYKKVCLDLLWTSHFLKVSHPLANALWDKAALCLLPCDAMHCHIVAGRSVVKIIAGRKLL